MEQAAPKAAAKSKARELSDLFSSDEESCNDVWSTARKNAEKDSDMITPWAQLPEHYIPIHPMRDSVSEIYGLLKPGTLGTPQSVLRKLALCLVRGGMNSCNGKAGALQPGA